MAAPRQIAGTSSGSAVCGLRPELHSQISGFHCIGNHALAAITGTKPLFVYVVLRLSSQALKVIPRGVVAHDFARRQTLQLDFTDTEVNRPGIFSGVIPAVRCTSA